MTALHGRQTAATAAAAATVSFGLAYLSAAHRSLAVSVSGGLALVAVVAVAPVGPALIAVPGVWLAGQRVGGLLSVGDALIVVAALAAIASGQTGDLPSPVRALGGALGILLGVDLVSVVTTASQAGAQELAHRCIVVMGAAITGMWLQRTDTWRRAARLLFAVSSVVAIAACVDALVHGPPAYPLGYHKNFAGGVFTVVIILLLAAPEACGIRARGPVRFLALALFFGGLLSTASRGAILGLALAVLVWILRPRATRRRVPPVVGLVLVVVLGYIALGSIQQQLTDASGGHKQNSITQRQDVEQATRDLWRTSPLVGVGLRYFNTPEHAGYQPPNNMFDEALAEAGVLGAAGLAVFVSSAIYIAFRLRTPLGEAAAMVLVNAFFHGQVDIFWANGQSLNWLVFGAAAVGAAQGLSVHATKHASANPTLNEDPIALEI